MPEPFSDTPTTDPDAPVRVRFRYGDGSRDYVTTTRSRRVAEATAKLLNESPDLRVRVRATVEDDDAAAEIAAYEGALKREP